MFKRIVVCPRRRPNGTVTGQLTGLYSASLPDAEVAERVCLDAVWVAGRRVQRVVPWVERAVMHGDYVIELTVS